MDPFAGNLVDQLVQRMAANGHWMLGFAEVASTDLDMNMTAPNASFEWHLDPAALFAGVGPSLNLMGTVDLSGLSWSASAADAFA